jgi:hypothetical protein
VSFIFGVERGMWSCEGVFKTVDPVTEVELVDLVSYFCREGEEGGRSLYRTELDVRMEIDGR